MSYYKEAIKKKFKDFEMNFEDHEDFIITDISGNNVKNIRIGVFFSEPENTIQIVSSDFISVRNKKREILELLNEKHKEYRWYRFTIEENGGLRCSVDTHLSKENAGFEFSILFVQMIQTIDEIYPELMRILWS